MQKAAVHNVGDHVPDAAHHNGEGFPQEPKDRQDNVEKELHRSEEKLHYRRKESNEAGECGVDRVADSAEEVKPAVAIGHSSPARGQRADLAEMPDGLFHLAVHQVGAELAHRPREEERSIVAHEILHRAHRGGAARALEAHTIADGHALDLFRLWHRSRSYLRAAGKEPRPVKSPPAAALPSVGPPPGPPPPPPPPGAGVVTGGGAAGAPKRPSRSASTALPFSRSFASCAVSAASVSSVASNAPTKCSVSDGSR